MRVSKLRVAKEGCWRARGIGEGGGEERLYERYSTVREVTEDRAEEYHEI